MIRVAGAILASLLVAAGALSPAGAFSPATRIRIAERAATLMPPALRRQLEKHRAELLRAALDPLKRGEGSGDHVLGPEGGTAADALDAAVREAVRSVDGQASFARSARDFGLIAHITADLSYPPNSSDDDPREADYYYRFGEFVESRLDRIPLVWLGWADEHLARGDLAAFAHRSATRARRDYLTVARSYYPEGREALPQDFDDRSPAFAAASLAFSHAVGDTARVWLYVWSRAHGDRHGTPYLRPGAKPFVPEEAEPEGMSP